MIQDNRCVFEKDGIVVSSAFEGGNGKNIRSAGSNVFRVDPDGDYGTYSEYFCCEARNSRRRPAHIVLQITSPHLVDESFTKQWDPGFRNSPLWIKRGGHWSRMPKDRVKITKRSLRAPIELGPGESQTVCHQIILRHSACRTRLRELARSNSKLCRILTVGKSALGRDVLALRIAGRRAESQKRICVVAGMHAVEPGTWGAIGIAETLLRAPDRCTELTRNYVFDIVPQVNPDGTVLGRTGVNAQGLDINRQFDRASGGQDAAREAVLLWNWLRERPPLLCLNLHGYSEGRKVPRPYLHDLKLWKNAKSRRTARRLQKALIEISAGEGHPCTRPAGLEQQLIRSFGTYAFLYEPHMRLGIQGNKRLCGKVFDTLVKTL